MTSGQLQDIVFILPSFAGGGAERVALTLANGLDRSRFVPRLLIFDATGPLKSEIAEDIEVIDLDRPRLRNAVLPLRRVLDRMAPKCVVSMMGYVNLAVLMACRPTLKATRFIVREANPPQATLNALGWPVLARWLYQRYYARADAVICPSRSIYREFIDEYGIPEDLLCVMRNPINTTRYRELAAVPHRNPGPGGRFVAAGRLTEQKGFDRLIEMFAGLPPDSQLTILGEGPLERVLRDQAEFLEISDRVHFAGYLDNPWSHYAGADAFLLPSRWEGMQNAALEALACGTPVIATPEAGGVDEIAVLAELGSVHLAQAGSQFQSVMAAIVPDPVAEPRPDLLPKEFDNGFVQKSFEELLTTTCAR